MTDHTHHKKPAPNGARRSSHVNRRRRVAAPCAVLTTLLLLVGIGWMSSSAMSQHSSASDVDSTRTTIEKWVETRRIISREKRDWELGKQLLNERIQLVTSEIASLRERIADAETNISEADQKRVELEEENEKLKQASASLEDNVLAYEARTRQLLDRLPTPILDRVKPLSQKLPDNPDDTELSLSERFQNVIGILNEINKFNSEITVTSEVRTLSDGTSAEVTSLYVGIGQGYYVGAKGKIAGYGTITENGWKWRSANDDAAEIGRAVAILKNEQVASFVNMPVEIK